jgi:hypothetical protein
MGWSPFEKNTKSVNATLNVLSESFLNSVVEVKNSCHASSSSSNIVNVTAQSLAVDFNAASGSRFWSRKIREFGELRVAEPRHLRPRYDRELKLSKDELGRYWMLVLSAKGPARGTSKAAARVEALDESTRENQAGDRPVAAIDPDVRTRHSIYMTNGRVVDVGKGDISRVIRLCRHIDRCISALKKGEFRVSERHAKRAPDASTMQLFDHYRPAKKEQGALVMKLDGRSRERIRAKMCRLRAKVQALKDEIDDQTVA